MENHHNDELDNSNQFNSSYSNFAHNNTRDIKLEQECYVSLNASQASSCDYSLSQFRKDESSFHIKAGDNDGEDESNDQQYQYDNSIAQDDSKVAIDDDDEEDIPIASRRLKREVSDDEDDVPLTSRKKVKTESKKVKKKKRAASDEGEEEDYDEKPKKKKVKKEKVIFE